MSVVEYYVSRVTVSVCVITFYIPFCVFSLGNCELGCQYQ